MTIVFIIAQYVAMVLVWRWLLRRWRLVGPDAPPRHVLGRHEYLARRSLRALLAFDFLVIFPVLVAAAAAMAPLVVQPGELPDRLPAEMMPAVLGLVMFAVAIPVLRRDVARLEQRRRDGLPEETDAQALQQARSTGHAGLDALLAARAWGTQAAALVIVASSIVAWVVPDDRLLLWLAKDNEAIRRGEVWRLVSVAMVHAGLVHLLFNVWILVDVGTMLERLVGTMRMLVVLVVGTASGTAASVAVVPGHSVGASGGILALAAALLLVGVRHRLELPPGARRRLVRTGAELVAINLVLTFVLANVDWAAHVGGFVAGAVLGWSMPLSGEATGALAAPSSPDPNAVAG